MDNQSEFAKALTHQKAENNKYINIKLEKTIVQLLSQQLYQSPIKAIEELVVNSYDAFAKTCKVFVPLSTDKDHEFIAVFDNGIGMDLDGLSDLWSVGNSHKRDETVQKKSSRKQIGKFGIGKLATSTVANQLTYLSKTDEGILGVTINFSIFRDEGEKINDLGTEQTIDQLQVYEIENLFKVIENNPILQSVINSLGLSTKELDSKSWTLAVLEDFTEKAEALKIGLLKWVLETAMPLSADFQIFLNNEKIISSKSDYKKVVEFDITELPQERIDAISRDTGELWEIKDASIVSPSFPQSISGSVFVTERTLYGQKSDDIQRSHGFFVRVHNRLVDLVDPLFGMKPLVYETLNRFNAQISADDLDQYLTASRDTIEESDLKKDFRRLLREIFNEAHSRYQRYLKENNSAGSNKEGEKELVAPRLVEEPLADALMYQNFGNVGSEANEDWFYLDMSSVDDINQLMQELYSQPRSKYKYEILSDGKTNRIVKFDPNESTFWINSDHEFVNEYGLTRFMEDFVTSEMLLEVYMKEFHLDSIVIGEILQKRDDLLRSLANDRSFSFKMIAQKLRDSANDEHDLEIYLVVAARALGFNATHVAGPKQPDGIARYTAYPEGVRKIILEAKSSSKDKKSEAEMDFAAIREHMEKYDGCLLVAPGYVAGELDNSKIAKTSQRQGISCWTIEQLATVVESAESRNIVAKDIYEIVSTKFMPTEVSAAIEELLQPSWSNRNLYIAIIDVLRKMEGSGLDRPRTVDQIGGVLMADEKFRGIKGADIEKAFEELASSSNGAIIYDRSGKGDFTLTSSIDELDRRVLSLTKKKSKGRRRSSFRNDEI